jgi:hypothetical protein
MVEGVEEVGLRAIFRCPLLVRADVSLPPQFSLGWPGAMGPWGQGLGASNHARVHREALAAHQTNSLATTYDVFKDRSQNFALAEAVVAIDREC